MLEDVDEHLDHDAEDEGPNYRGRALQICDDLHDDDIESLKFISRDFIPGAKLERLKGPHDLLSLWEKAGKFGQKNPWFLAECLFKIQRIDLLEEDLGIEQYVLEERIQQGQSQISDFRRTLLEVAEDLDTEELHKMVYLIDDLKKKDKEKIHNPMNFIAHLEKTKTITEKNVHKLKEILKNIDRNDLADLLMKYEASHGLAEFPAGLTNREEYMDTSDPPYPAYRQLGKPAHRTIAESPAIAREIPVGVASEASSGLRAETARAAAVALTPNQQPEVVTQNVIVEPLLLDIAHQLGREVNDQTWIVFGYQLNVLPETLQQLSRRYPQMNDRMFHLLKVWLHSWQSGHEAAMAAIINALHEVQIHHLAEQFSRIYTTQQGTSELQGVSLSSRTMGPRSNEHENISVITGEARYREDPEDPSAEVRPALATTATTATTATRATIATTAAETVPDIMPFYRMDNKPRGLCIIINNERFQKDPTDSTARDMPKREGTNVDADGLLQTFTELYFEVRQYDNLTSSEMVRLLVDVSLNVNHTKYDCFVCCILSHGTQGHLYGTDGRLVNITDLTGPFKSVVCPTLAGKPKLFFIQACQGREKQPGEEIERDGAEPEIDGISREVIPNEADFLIGYATVPGFVSYRSRTHGSWYVTKLCEMLNKYGTKYDLLSVLILVNNEVGRANAMMDGGRYKQSPAPLYTLRKKLMFK